jgi:hypothetical protein
MMIMNLVLLKNILVKEIRTIIFVRFGICHGLNLGNFMKHGLTTWNGNLELGALEIEI